MEAATDDGLSEWDRRMLEEKRQQRTFIEAKTEHLREVALALSEITGEDWMLDHQQSAYHEKLLPWLGGPDDMRLSVSPDHQDSGRVRYCVVWPRPQTESYTVDPRKRERVNGEWVYPWKSGITLGWFRSPKDHARDIERRLLKNLRPVWPEARLRVLEIDNNNHAFWRHVEDFAARLGGEAHQKTAHGRHRGETNLAVKRPDAVELGWYTADHSRPHLRAEFSSYSTTHVKLDIEGMTRQQQLALALAIRDILDQPEG